MTTPTGLYVVAGTNGAGKSSVMGEFITRAGGAFYNPDTWTARLLEADPAMGLDRANATAWAQMVRLIDRAVDEHALFAFETTLGGRTITGRLLAAAEAGIEVHLWYVGLSSADLHIERVRRRVAAGGHDIAESRIRERCLSSRANLIRLLPHLATLAIFDNSADVDSDEAGPGPIRLLEMEAGRIVTVADTIPPWAADIVAVARSLQAGPAA
ncbi:MAG TPA: AAA family ATPase [Iamia sp.]